jgi:hypothetical protein
MGISTRINLPLHVSASGVLQVIGKCVGAVFTVKTFDLTSVKTPIPDMNKPSSKENQWFVDFSNKNLKVNSEGRLDYGTFEFEDMALNKYQWLFHQETEHEDHKSINPGSSAMAVAVGVRLVKFFGGSVQFCDHTDKADYIVNAKKAVFPPKTNGQSSDDRWYQYQNALRGLPVLTIKELEAASKKSSYGLGEKGEALLVALRCAEHEAALESEVKVASSKQNKIRL